jgi:hypothetical protein
MMKFKIAAPTIGTAVILIPFPAFLEGLPPDLRP